MACGDLLWEPLREFGRDLQVFDPECRLQRPADHPMTENRVDKILTLCNTFKSRVKCLRWLPPISETSGHRASLCNTSQMPILVSTASLRLLLCRSPRLPQGVKGLEHPVDPVEEGEHSINVADI